MGFRGFNGIRYINSETTHAPNMTTTPVARWRLAPADVAVVNHLQDKTGLHRVFCQLLAQRGITTPAAAATFFDPQLNALHDPFRMKGMEAAVTRLHTAIDRKETILLYGDYDVDGTTSVALLHQFLAPIHNNLDYYLPDRYAEGYGLSRKGIDHAHTQGATLMLVVDCGIRAVAQVAYAKTLGIDVVICDHHHPGPIIPDAVAVLDPKRADCAYPYKELSGCGVAFKLAQAYTARYKLPTEPLYALLDYLVISIAADIVPITGENRILAYWGLKTLNKTKRAGLLTLLTQSNRQPPLTITDIVFGFAPRLNAAGRMGDARLAVRLLLADDRQHATDLAQQLETRNNLRREYDRQTAEEGKAMVAAHPEWHHARSLVLYHPEWHKGVVGIAAARMVEAFHKPTVMLTENHGRLTGSARSVRGFNVYEALLACEDLLENFGGHDYAAGLTLRPENLERFRERFEEAVAERIERTLLRPELQLNAVLNFPDITPEFWQTLQRFAPFGPGNRSPLFGSKHIQDIGYSKALRNNHLRLAVRQPDSTTLYGIAFGKGNLIEQVQQHPAFYLAYKLEEDHWNERTRLQLMVKDLKFPKVERAN